MISTATNTIRHAVLSLIVFSFAGVVACGAAVAADTVDPGRHCLRQWPNDRDSFLLCQHLQNRNHLSFRRFLAAHGLSEKALEHGEKTGNPVAGAAAYCLKHWSPDYQGVWQCTQRRTDTQR